MTPEQDERISLIAKLLGVAGYELADAFDTGLMSDAKSAVYAVYSELESDKVLSPEIKEKLLGHGNAAWSAVTSSKDTYGRAGDALFQIGEAQRYLEKLAQGAA